MRDHGNLVLYSSMCIRTDDKMVSKMATDSRYSGFVKVLAKIVVLMQVKLFVTFC